MIYCMKLKRKIFSKNILIFLFFIFFAGGVGFAQNSVSYGMLAPESETTIIWNNGNWTYSDDSVVNWGGSVAAGGHPDQNLILDTSKASITIILETDLTWQINNLYIFGENECVFILNGFSIPIGNLYLGDSCSSATSIDSLISSGVITQNKRKGNIKIETGNFNINGVLDTSSPGKHSINLQETTLTVSSGWNTGTEGTGAEVPIFTSNNGTINLNQAGLNGDFQTEIIDSVTNVNNNPSVTPPSDPTPTEAIWEGTENSSWDNPNNWNTGEVPDGSMPIIIDGSARNQPEINSDVIITFTDENKITFNNEAKLTIGNSGSLTIDSEKFDFQPDSSKIIVNGTLNLTKDSPVDDFIMDSHFDSDSSGTISCDDSVTSLIVTQEFTKLNAIKVNNGELTVYQNFTCDQIEAKTVEFKNGMEISCNSINAESLTNGGDLTVNSELQVSSITNQHKLTIADTVTLIQQISSLTNDAELNLNVDTSVEEMTNNQNGIITVADGKYLDVKKQFSNNGIFTGSIKFTGDNIFSGNNSLGDANSKYTELFINTSKPIQFEGDSVIETLEVVSAKSVKFLSAVTINKIDDIDFTGDFYFDATKFDQNTGGLSTSEGFKFNTSGDVYIGKDSTSQISFVNSTSPVNFTHTAGKTLITGNLSANDVTLSETEISGTITANNITLEETEIIGDSELNTSGKITLKGNISSTDSKSLTLNGNVEIPTTSTSQLEINLNEGILETKAIKSESSLSIKAKTQTFGGTISVENEFTSEGETFTFAGKVTVNQNAQIQNTGLLKISDFVYGKSFVQEGIGQVMISGSFEQSGESGASEKPPATFRSNVYFYNSSQNLSPITIGSDKSYIEIKENLIIAKSKENDVAIKGTVKSKNFALYSGNVNLSGELSTEKDVVILGENYSLKDDQTGIENLYSYNENRPANWSQASYAFETSLPDGTPLPDGTISNKYAGTVKVLPEKSITVKKNLYANGTVFALFGALGSGTWKLNVPDTSVAANAFCEVYNSEVSDCVAAYQIAALQCTDKSGNINWAFDDETGTVKITKAYSVSDNVIRVEFNKPVRILKDRFTQKQMRFSNGPDENHYFENVYLDEKCTTETSEVVNQYYEENGNKNYYVYVKANSKWNTDATGTFVGEEKSTDYDGVHQNTTICLDFPRAIVATTQSGENFFSYIITDLWGKRLTNYSVRTTSGTQKTSFEDVEDKTGPVLISVKTGQENHTEYDGSKGAQSQPSYDSHNFIEFVYSEFVNFGTEPAENVAENPDGAEEVFLKADDQGIENAKNIQVTQKFGALQNEDITQSGELKFAGLAKIQNGKIYTGSLGNADKYVNALYRFDKYSLRYSIAGYTHPTEFVQDDQGKDHKKWIGYIQEAELPTGTVSMICDGKNDLVFDMAGNSQTLVKNNLTVDSSKSGVYGNWDISKPIFAPLRMNETQPWKDNEYIEAIGNNKGFGDTLDRVEFHLFDNTPNFDFTDEAVWITERGWCRNNSSNRASLIFDDSYCADIFGGSRAFDFDKENRTAGGIRFSSLENAVNAFRYTTKTDTNPSEKFDVNSEIVIGANVRLFTGNSDVYRDASVMDGLYFSLLLNDKSLNVKTTFKLSYDDKIGYITDLAGNRLKSKTAFSVDRTPPSIKSVLSPIDNKTFYIIFTKKLNLSKILLLDNDLNEIEISESFLELLPQCFELITINDDGTFVASDIQIDSKIAAEPVSVLDNGNYTAFKMVFTRDVSLEDVKNVYLRVVNPKKYDYKMCDPITNIKDSYVTLIQDDLGNYIDMFQTHAISEVAINGINPLYGYNSSIQEDKKPITSITQDEVSFVVRDWNENQQNYGTFYHDKDITIVCDVDNTSKTENNFAGNVNLYFNNDTENKMSSEQFNKKIGGNLRIWFPNIMENHFDFFTYNKNANYGTICSERVDEDDISAGLKFDFPKSVVENWKSGNQISFLFSYLNEDNSQLNIYPVPKFNLLTGLYELNNSMKFPLFAIRMKDVNDITSLDLWSFKVKSVTNQRGGVTILNNVINATYGEKAIVKINLPQDGNLDVMVMTLDGNIVTYLNHGATTSGEHYFTWNGTNNAGSKVARGLYFVRVISSTIDETRKIMVVKD